METTGGTGSVEALQVFLKNIGDKVQSTSIPFNLFFPSIRYEWEANLTEKTPKSLDEFLKTTIYNSVTKRTALEIQEWSGLGQPGLEIILKPDQIPNAFYLEVYHWKNEAGSEKPENIASRVATLSGVPKNTEEMGLDYHKRVASEGKGTYKEEERGEEKLMTFESPINGVPDMTLSGKILSIKKGEKYSLKEISLDIKIPYEAIGSWLKESKH